MFGMEKKEKESSSFVFDLEKSLIDEKSRIILAAKLEERIRKIKEVLHSGSSKEFFEKLGVMLNGYHALAIVLGRASQASKKQRA